jgi:hypothetical protein
MEAEVIGQTYILGSDGKPQLCEDRTVWGLWFGDANNRMIQRDYVGDVAEVSTVFLGIDHGWTEGEEPVLFETMIFGGPLDKAQQRYHTIEEARLGHAKMLEAARGWRPQPARRLSVVP